MASSWSRLKVSAPDVAELGCVDQIIPEPDGGNHIDAPGAAEILAAALEKHLTELRKLSTDALVAARQQKFRKIAQFYTEG